MRTVTRRIGKLEDRFWLGNGKLPLLLVFCRAGWGLALDKDRCIHILSECGFLPTGLVGLVNLCQIPDGLNAEELERYLMGKRRGDSRFPRCSKFMMGQQAQADARLHDVVSVRTRIRRSIQIC